MPVVPLSAERKARLDDAFSKGLIVFGHRRPTTVNAPLRETNTKVKTTEEMEAKVIGSDAVASPQDPLAASGKN